MVTIEVKYKRMIRYSMIIRTLFLQAFKYHFLSQPCRTCGARRHYLENPEDKEYAEKNHIEPMSWGPKFDSTWGASIITCYYRCRECKQDDDDVLCWPEDARIVFEYWKKKDKKWISKIFTVKK